MSTTVRAMVVETTHSNPHDVLVESEWNNLRFRHTFPLGDCPRLGDTVVLRLEPVVGRAAPMVFVVRWEKAEDGDD